jgi:hypothetical protein
MGDLPAGFTMRYAVRLPHGLLYSMAPQQRPSTADYWAIPSPVRDMLGYTEPTAPPPPKPVIYDKRADAEELLKQIREAAAGVGVTEIGACIVEQLCTPFTSGDAAVEFAAEVQCWLAEHGGDA